MDATPIQSKRYRVEEVLGSGEIGVVFRAHDLERDEDVALKTIRERSAEHIYNLKREFRSLRQVQHPNLVRLFELVVDHEDAFFTMELVDGQTVVGGLHDDNPALEDLLPTVRERFSQLAVGIHALHLAEKLHRDLKPTNVLIEAKTGRVVIVDFGLAVGTIGGQTSGSVHGELAGTYAYMPPEQGWGKALTPAADWYAFGVTLFEAIHGALPWPGSPAEAFQRKQMGPAPVDMLRERGLEPRWVDLISGLTDPNPEARPGAEEVLSFFAVDVADGVSAKAQVPQLFGRDEAEALFDQALDRPTKPDGAPTGTAQRRVVEVTGKSGMGKTSFLAAQMAHQKQRNETATTLSGCCYQDVTAPFAALDELMDNLSRLLLALPTAKQETLIGPSLFPLTTLFPILERVPSLVRADITDPIRARRLATRGFAALLQELAREGPVSLWLDDLQWADQESAHLLADAMEFVPDACQVDLVLAHRKEEPSQFVEVLRNRLGGQTEWNEVPLSPLGNDALRQLAQAVTRSLPLDDTERESRVQRVVQDSGGVPFTAGLLARSSTPQGIGSPASGTGVPSWMHVLVTQDLSPLEAEVLSVASMSSTPLPEAALLLAAGGDLDVAKKALVELGRRSLLRCRARDGRWEMVHDRIRVSVAAGIETDRRLDLERRLATALDASDDERVRAQAWPHWRSIGEHSKAAWGAYVAGKDAASKFAFGQAVDCFEQALLDHEAAGVSLDEVLRQLGHASACLGRVQEAADQLLMAAAAAPPDLAIDDERRAAELLIGAGEIAKGRAILTGTFAKIGAELPKNSLGAALLGRGRLWIHGLKQKSRAPTQADIARADTWWVAVGALGYVEPLASFIAQTEHLRQILMFEDANRFARALALEVVYLGSRKASPRVEALEKRLLEYSEEELTPEVFAFVTLSRGYLAFLQGRFTRSEELLEKTLDLYLRVAGQRWQENLGRIHLVFVQLYLGDFERAAILYEEQRHILRRTGDRLNMGMLELGAGFAVCLARDEVPAARAKLDDAWNSFPVLPDNLSYIGTLGRVQTELVAADIDAAIQCWEENKGLVKRMRVFENALVMFSWFEGLLGLRQKTPDLGRARKSIKSMRKTKAGWAVALAAVLETGVCFHESGDRAVAIRAADNAAERLRAASMQTHAAAIDLWRGIFSDDTGLVQRSRAKMQSAGLRTPERWLLMWAPVDPADF